MNSQKILTNKKNDKKTYLLDNNGEKGGQKSSFIPDKIYSEK